MKLKKYLILDCDVQVNKATKETETKINLKVVTGFTEKELSEQFDIKTTWTPQDNNKDVLFFFSGCTVPRFKVRQKWTTTIKPSKATVLFIDPANIDESESTFSVKKIGKVKIDKIISFLLALKDDHIRTLANSIIPNVEDIFLGETLWDQKRYNTSFTVDGSCLKDHGITKWDIMYEREGCYTTKLCCLSPTSDLHKVDFEKTQVCHTDAVLGLLNENKLVIDENKYHELVSLAESSQSEDVVVMMELMANSDYDNSLPYLLGLFHKFGSKINGRKEANHVNFKSLMNYCNFQARDLAYNISLQKMIDVLKAHKKFTRENALTIMSLSNTIEEFDN